MRMGSYWWRKKGAGETIILVGKRNAEFAGGESTCAILDELIEEKLMGSCSLTN